MAIPTQALLLTLVHLCISVSYLRAQAPARPFAQRADYDIHVRLNDTAHTLSGYETITYYNRSTDTLRYVYIHLWPNAYKHDRTAFARQTLELGNLDFYFSEPQERGSIYGLAFTQNHLAATLVETEEADVAKLLLPLALAPGDSTRLYTPFTVKIPRVFSRMGHVGQEYFLSQFYPKVAKYDANGWHQMPYLDVGEYYNDFGAYALTLTLPQNYRVLGTGIQAADVDTINTESARHWQALKRKKVSIEKALLSPPASSLACKTIVLRSEQSTDIAFSASKWHQISAATLRREPLKGVRIYTAEYPWKPATKYGTLDVITSALYQYSNAIGPYWQKSMSVVHCPVNLGMAGGMEYPGYTVITTPAKNLLDRAVIIHEVGHNWFQGALASNERLYPWMDEGINSFYEENPYARLWNERRQARPRNSTVKGGIPAIMRSVYAGLSRVKRLPPYHVAAGTAPVMISSILPYEMPKILLDTLMYQDTALFIQNMRSYYRQWAGHHPQPADFFAAMDSGRTPGHTQALFGKLDYAGRNFSGGKPRVTAFWKFPEPENSYAIRVGPAIGFNKYDKPMLGLFATSYGPEMRAFEWMAAPMYSTGTGGLVGAARVAYNVYRQKWWLQLSASAMSYNVASLPEPNEDVNLRMMRLVPALQLRWYKNAQYDKHYTLRLKRFQIGEEQFDFSSSSGPSKTSMQQRYVHRLSFGYQHNTALYPYEYQISIDQGDEWMRAGVSYEQFFQYNASKEGLQVRVFGGKFFYLKPETLSRNFSTLPYQLQLSGPRGNEDYTYSGYFVERNAFEGLASQQMMKRDGYMKVSTDLLSDKVGRSDDWIAALNLSTHIPRKWNPLSVLPIPIPLRVFADVGTYAEAWSDANLGKSRFLYNAGVSVSVLNNAVQVFFPLLSSKVFRDYNKTVLGPGSFAKTIAFSIDLERFQLQKMSRYIPL